MKILRELFGPLFTRIDDINNGRFHNRPEKSILQPIRDKIYSLDYSEAINFISTPIEWVNTTYENREAIKELLRRKIAGDWEDPEYLPSVSWQDELKDDYDEFIGELVTYRVELDRINDKLTELQFSTSTEAPHKHLRLKMTLAEVVGLVRVLHEANLLDGVDIKDIKFIVMNNFRAQTGSGGKLSGIKKVLNPTPNTLIKLSEKVSHIRTTIGNMKNP